MLQSISLEKVQQLTILLQKVADLCNDDEQLKTDLKRESVAIFSHVNLAVKGRLALSERKLLDDIMGICGHLDVLKRLPSMKDVQIGILEKSYLAMYRSFAGEKSNEASSPSQQTRPAPLATPKQVEQALPAKKTENELALTFSNRWTLTIFNKFELTDGQRQVVEVQESLLAHQSVLEASLDKECLSLLFDSGARLRVDLTDAGYLGPEAAVITGPDRKLFTIP